MVDIFIDNILENEKKKRNLKEQIIKMIKIYGLIDSVDWFIGCCNEYSRRYGNKHIPNSVFTGKKDIIEIADDFELKPLGKKLRICPFHKDTNPSLSLSPKKNVFNCFGCGIKGNIITFYGELKKLRLNKSVIKRRI